MREPKYVKLIEYVRNGLREQVHFGLIIHMNKERIIKKIGEDNNYKFYHRSCMKPLQVSPLIDLGLDEKYKLTEEEIAVCCASHTGDKIHQKYIKSFLNKTGFSENELLCPEHEPLSKKECDNLIIKGLLPKKIHNNCSGKHSAMLAICKEKGFNYENYKDMDNPLCEYIINHVCNLCEVNRNDIVISKDGCGLPVIATTLQELGRGFLNLFTNEKYKRIKNAFLNHPVLIGGEGRTDTKIIQNTKNIIAKVGACGLCVIVNIEKEEAIVIKIADSNMQAREFAAFEAIKQEKWIEENSIRINNLINREIRTLDFILVGEVNFLF